VVCVRVCVPACVCVSCMCVRAQLYLQSKFILIAYTQMLLDLLQKWPARPVFSPLIFNNDPVDPAVVLSAL
jgi:hypothetical protein